MNPLQEVFFCKKCGQCCYGEGGIVLSERDIGRLLSFLGLCREDFLTTMTRLSNKKHKLKTGENGACIFFKPGEGCSVHPAKPDVCRAWPFFRGNLDDPHSLAMARDYCPGIDRDCSFDSFRSAGFHYLHAEDLITENSDANALNVAVLEERFHLSRPGGK